MNTHAQRQGYVDGGMTRPMRAPANRDYAIGWIEAIDDRLNRLLTAAAEISA